MPITRHTGVMMSCVLIVHASISRCGDINIYTTTYATLVFTSKEKLSLTRKLVGYRNWRQRWCKKEGNKVFGKEK